MGTPVSTPKKQNDGQVPGQQNRQLAQTVKSESTKKERAMICAAIDFGTTYSGYAFSFAHSPLEIKANYWPDGSIKTPTVILLDPDGRFHSFGKEAMDKYSSLLHAKEHKQWFYFDRIKMVLYEKGTPLNLDVTIEDKEGKQMKAIDIFTMAIEYFVHQLVATVTDKNRLDGLNFTPSKDIHWMVTVPAIWNDKSKLFMRNAAVKVRV
ncbi:heat shock 70 kDa protein 12A-like [Mya arenaria]|uniref:heat shock 70 kDa protein 12A-like n=1 Tax=Mya arenaria TaxID=6604 RepID=UPI0022E91741|nr:heat shock 70 kDa protein 12A-like [Mya arenaria]